MQKNVNKIAEKETFSKNLKAFVSELTDYVSADDGQWTVKGFIDIFKNVYTLSADTKIVSKVLEIHLFEFLRLLKLMGISSS
jgi:hypothetical protein